MLSEGFLVSPLGEALKSLRIVSMIEIMVGSKTYAIWFYICEPRTRFSCQTMELMKPLKCSSHFT